MSSQRDVARALEPGETRAILLFASAEFLDVATTLIGLRSGRFVEGNPASNLLGRTEVLMALKLLVVISILLLVHRFVSPGRHAGALILMAAIAMAAPILNVAHLLTG